MEEQEIPSEDERLLQAVQQAMENGDAAAIQSATADLMAHISEQPMTPDLALTLQAHQFEAQGQWEQAEAAYRQALALVEAENNDALVFKEYDNLSHLYTFLGQKERALEAAQAAMVSARRYNIKPVLGMALETLVRCQLAIGDPVQALQTAAEMVALFAPDEVMSKIQRPRSLILRARCYGVLGQDREAQQDLEAAWPLLKPQSGSVQANWWEVTAQLKSQAADFEGAVTAWHNAVKYRRIISRTSMLENPYKDAPLAGSLRCLGMALLAIEDVAGSEAALQESQAIDKMLHRPAR